MSQFLSSFIAKYIFENCDSRLIVAMRVLRHGLKASIREGRWAPEYISTDARTASPDLNIMSGSGKSLLGLWLYRSGEDWAVKEECPLQQTTNTVSHQITLLLVKRLLNIFNKL